MLKWQAKSQRGRQSKKTAAVCHVRLSKADLMELETQRCRGKRFFAKFLPAHSLKESSGLVASGLVTQVPSIFLSQFDYLARLCERTGTPMFEPWREDLFQEFGERRHLYPATYRDEWPEDLEHKKQVIWQELQEQVAKST